MRAQFHNSSKYNHLTVLGFTVADGRAVMCAIIIATYLNEFNQLSKDAEGVSSDDMKLLEDEIEQMEDEHRNGVDRMFQFGPICSFNGNEVPTVVTFSNNGSSTSQLLSNIMLSTGYGGHFEEYFLNIHWRETYLGHVVLVCCMVHLCGKLVIVSSKIEHLK
jgi:hypothetical protein